MFGDPEDKSVYGGRFYSNKAPGLSLAAVPAYAAVRVFTGAARPANATTVFYLVRLLTVTAVSIAALFALARRLVKSAADPRWAPLILFGVAFGTPFLVYARSFFSHAWTAALLYLAFECLHREKEEAWHAPLAGFLAGWAVLSEYPAAVVAVLLLLDASWRRPWRRPFLVHRRRAASGGCSGNLRRRVLRRAVRPLLGARVVSAIFEALKSQILRIRAAFAFDRLEAPAVPFARRPRRVALLPVPPRGVRVGEDPRPGPSGFDFRSSSPRCAPTRRHGAGESSGLAPAGPLFRGVAARRNRAPEISRSTCSRGRHVRAVLLLHVLVLSRRTGPPRASSPLSGSRGWFVPTLAGVSAGGMALDRERDPATRRCGACSKTRRSSLPRCSPAPRVLLFFAGPAPRGNFGIG